MTATTLKLGYLFRLLKLGDRTDLLRLLKLCNATTLKLGYLFRLLKLGDRTELLPAAKFGDLSQVVFFRLLSLVTAQCCIRLLDILTATFFPASNLF
mgnify:FL=1